MQERQVTKYFRISVLLKGFHALFEIVGGLLLAFIPPAIVLSVVEALTQYELLEDPHDLVANFFLSVAQQFSITGSLFASVYLLSHGVIKLALVAALLRNVRPAYPISMIVLGTFAVYQMYRFSITHSPALIALTIFDAVVIWLIWREYKILREATTNPA